MDCAELQWGLFAGRQEWHFQAAKRSDKSVPFCKTVDLLLLRNNVFRVRKVEKWTVLSSNEVNMLMLRNRVFVVRNAQIWAVLSSNEANLLIFRNGFFSLRNVQIWVVLSW